jgi:hypothetical protein
MTKRDELIILEKAEQIAFLSLRKCRVTPFVKPNGRVAFSVRGDITGALAELEGNAKVPILDFLKRLESVKSVIYAMKGNESYRRRECRDVDLQTEKSSLYPYRPYVSEYCREYTCHLDKTPEEQRRREGTR